MARGAVCLAMTTPATTAEPATTAKVVWGNVCGVFWGATCCCGAMCLRQPWNVAFAQTQVALCAGLRVGLPIWGVGGVVP